MAYPSLHRVLGASSLERKCRILFGTCLFLLISGAFVWVDMVSERLIQRANESLIMSARLRAGNSAEHWMLKLHLANIDSLFDESTARGDDDERRLLLKKMIEMIVRPDSKDFVCAVISPASSPHATPPNEYERNEVFPELAEQLARLPLVEPEDEIDALLTLREQPAAFMETLSNDRKTYIYYQGYVKSRCTPCHAGPVDSLAGAIDANDLRLIKVAMPYDYARETARTQIRAPLIAAGIITFFVAMVALYVIVRVVIVNPLTHLREVSDAIRQGNTEARVDMPPSNDEFQELAESFNRMLRHLTESQVNLRQANQELDAKVDELAQLNMQLYEMNRLKSDFLANMSHELRTPLNSIIGFSEVLQGIDALGEKQKRYVENIQNSGRVLLEMINDILDLAKLEAGKAQVNPSEFRLGAIVNAQCDLVRTLSEEKNIDLKTRVEPDLPLAFQDQAKFQQILTNLLSNAIKFTPEGGLIVVETKATPDGEHFVLSVADTGVGIAEEDREIIFEKFRQSNAVLGQDGLTREYSGTGLGLSIVKELCKLLGGEIDFDSHLGQGSTFRVTLPFNCEELPQDDPSQLLPGAAREDKIVPARW